LFFFVREAVWVIIFLDVVVVLLLFPFGGVSIELPIERSLKSLNLFIDGALVAVAFYSKINIEFKSLRKL